MTIEDLLKSGSTEWNKLRKGGKVGTDHTGATFENLFSANADLSGLVLVGSEWDRCDLSKVTFRESDLSGAYFHGGRLQDCDFRGANLEGATFERLKLLRCDFAGAVGLEALEFGRGGHGPRGGPGRRGGARPAAPAGAGNYLLHPRAAAGERGSASPGRTRCRPSRPRTHPERCFSGV